MKTKCIACLSLLLCNLCIINFSRTQKGTHALFAEGLGAGEAYSINYDKILFATNRTINSVRIGASGLYHQVDTNKKGLDLIFPLMFNQLIPQKNKKHNFEMGLGISTGWVYHGSELQLTVKRQMWWALTGFLGYRYQNPNGGLMLRAGWDPFYSITDDWLIWYWPALGIGYSF